VEIRGQEEEPHLSGFIIETVEKSLSDEKDV